MKYLLVALSTIFLLCFPRMSTSASPSLKSIRQLDVKKITSIDEMRAAVDMIAESQAKALAENWFTIDFQKLVLSKSGECISVIASIYKNAPHLNFAETNEAAKQLHLDIRNTINKILETNEKIISDLQENVLDQLEDTTVFFRSPQWQAPQYLISLSSYWLGWNGYYGSLVLSENDPMNQFLLDEAIKGFSRAFVDFSEDTAIARSLFGRGLCYSRLNKNEKARKDFKIAQMKMSKDDPLYFRCLYEDVRIIYRTGNFETAQRRLDEIAEDFPKEKMPEEIATALEKLKSKVLIALLEKQNREEKKEIILQDRQNKDFFNQARQLALNPDNQAEFYRYVQDNWKNLKDLTFQELGPVAIMAIGDMYFDRKKYDKALYFYQALHADFPSYLSNRLGSLWFRTAYSYCKKEQWHQSLPFLDTFHEKFPNSSLAKQAADLYYAAATHYYEQKDTKKAQKHFIDSIHLYIEQNKGNSPELSEAHFKLGKYYYKAGDIKRAIAEFSAVKGDSSNYPAAQYYVLQNYVDDLKNLEKRGQLHSKTAANIYNKGAGLLKTYKDVIANRKESVSLKENNAHMTVLESQLLIFGPSKGFQNIIKYLDNFEREFPLQNKLHLEAFRLRLACYHRLRMEDEIQKEIDQFTAPKSLKGERLALLHRLGNMYFQNDENLKKEVSESNNSRNWDTALLIYDKLHDISRNHPEYVSYSESAQLRMARIYIHKDQLEKAEILYRDILEKNSLSADAVYSLGLLYEKKEQWEDALGIWRRFSNGIEEGTFHWFESRYRIAMAHLNLGNINKACDILTITLVLHPDFGKDELKEKFLDLKSNACQ